MHTIDRRGRAAITKGRPGGSTHHETCHAATILRTRCRSRRAGPQPRASRWRRPYPNKPVTLRGRLRGPAAPMTSSPACLANGWPSGFGQPFHRRKPRPGASGKHRGGKRSPSPTPDGYTLLSSTPRTPSNATLYDKLNFNFATDNRAGRWHPCEVPNIMEVDAVAAR